MVSGYLDPARLLSLHPDTAQLAEFDRKIARARQFPTPVPIQPLRSPEPLQLAAPELPTPGMPPSRTVDAARIRESIHEDFDVRRRARPEEDEQRYRQDLERLRRRFVELRLEARPAEDHTDLDEALRNARRYSELEEQLRALRERPEDRLFYTPAQLSRRRELYRLTQQEQEALRQAETARLERALDPTANRNRNLARQERQIPPEELARAAKERDARRQEALELLARWEQSAIESALDTELPPVAEPVNPLREPALPPEELNTEREATAARVEGSNEAKITLPSARAAASSATSLADLGKLREELRQRIWEEVRAAAVAAARKQGISPTFSPGAAPDRTAQIAPEVVRLLSGRIRSGAR